MKTYRVVLAGRNTRSALEQRARDEMLIEAWDAGEARQQAQRHIVQTQIRRGPLVLAGVRCDEVAVVDVRKAGRAR